MWGQDVAEVITASFGTAVEEIDWRLVKAIRFCAIVNLSMGWMLTGGRASRDKCGAAGKGWSWLTLRGQAGHHSPARPLGWMAGRLQVVGSGNGDR